MDAIPSLQELWTRAVSDHAECGFLTYEDPSGRLTSWTYGAFDELVGRAATWLHRAGAGPGDRVHLALSNCPAFVALWLAAARMGACIVPSDPRASVRELGEHVERVQPVVGVCDAPLAPGYAQAVAGRFPTAEVSQSDVALWKGLPVSGAYAVEPRTPAAIMFTSGTTSAPKGVVVTQVNYGFAATTMAARAGMTADDRALVVLPLFHANAQYYSIAPAIAVGAEVRLIARFSASRFVAQAARHGATHASLFAAPIRMILSRTATGAEPLRLRHCWFAQNLSDQQFDAFSHLVGCRPRQLYGMTETIPAVLTSPEGAALHTSIGVPTPGCHVELRSPDSFQAVGPGEVGEIAVGGEPAVTLFSAYLDDPETTAAAFRDGLFLTGDLAVRDEEGRYFFHGRRGDVMKVAGENVSAVEVEAVVGSHPAVLDVAVVAAPDPVRDQVPIAYVVPRDGELDLADLERFSVERLAPSKRPRRFIAVESLPRTSVGKVRKHLLGRDA